MFLWLWRSVAVRSRALCNKQVERLSPWEEGEGPLRRRKQSWRAEVRREGDSWILRKLTLWKEERKREGRSKV